MKTANQKAAEVAERNAAWQALSPAEQLAEIDARLGVGIGASRQRKVLAALLDNPEAPEKAKRKKS